MASSRLTRSLDRPLPPSHPHGCPTLHKGSVQCSHPPMERTAPSRYAACIPTPTWPPRSCETDFSHICLKHIGGYLPTRNPRVHLSTARHHSQAFPAAIASYLATLSLNPAFSLSVRFLHSPARRRNESLALSPIGRPALSRSFMKSVYPLVRGLDGVLVAAGATTGAYLALSWSLILLQASASLRETIGNASSLLYLCDGR